jgi:hypothetical protein
MSETTLARRAALTRRTRPHARQSADRHRRRSRRTGWPRASFAPRVPVAVYEAIRRSPDSPAAASPTPTVSPTTLARTSSPTGWPMRSASERCRVVRLYEKLLLDGRHYSYPLGLVRQPCFVLGSANGTRRDQQLRGTPQPLLSAADWFRSEYGPRLANETPCPLLEAWSGSPATELAPPAGRRCSAEDPCAYPAARQPGDAAGDRQRVLPRSRKASGSARVPGVAWAALCHLARGSTTRST